MHVKFIVFFLLLEVYIALDVLNGSLFILYFCAIYVFVLLYAVLFSLLFKIY